MLGRSALLLVACAGTLLAQEPPTRVTFADLLDAVHDLDALTRPPAPGEACVQFSSYDRRSDAGPADADAWYANGDRGQFLRTIENGDRNEHVLVDADGPGAVVRIWSANPSGKLFFYFDGEATPRWTVDFGALLRGEIDGLGEPLAGMQSRGGNCHLPIPFARHLVVSSDASDFYYQVNVRRLATGAATESFDPAWLQSRHDEIAAAAKRLAPGDRSPTLPAGAKRLRGHVTRRSGEVHDSRPMWTQHLDGPGVLRGLRIRPSTSDATALPAVLRTLRLRVDCDGEVTVDVPFADFFASAPAFHPWHGLALGVADDGTGYCDFPMPCEDRIDVSIVTDGALPCDVRTDWELVFVPGAVASDTLRFRASWHLDKNRRTRPFGDHLVLDATGPGRYVGTCAVIRNPTKAWWGEGDEKITVDGEAFPSTFGTGTEDYFGYAWSSPEPFDHPLHAQPQCDGPANFGYTCDVRLHVPDQVPFDESLHFDLEVWHWQDVVMDYATTAYWYGAKGASSGLPPMPPVAARLPVAMASPDAWAADNALEGEDLKVLECTGGNVQPQGMGLFADGRWSRGKQLWWTGGATGEHLTLAVPVEHAGRYQVEAAFTRAPDYGRLRVSVNGVAVGETVDLFAPTVRATGPQMLGTVDLPAGDARFELAIVGKNDSAVPGYMVGLDYLRLTPVPAPK